jgi:hypothetical protein
VLGQNREPVSEVACYPFSGNSLKTKFLVSWYGKLSVIDKRKVLLLQQFEMYGISIIIFNERLSSVSFYCSGKDHKFKCMYFMRS